ncbi:hypothetical protein [Syntrophothermus lipocalidus]|uniref:Uncharacterized protein n=1 Tax=Syntrophothermus lipocalidus (strain DSM 12680 / TGB-C1) TaxID=643648 RepID=D7CNT7_SYNLT|nr:hypothetical protein [Syntrophothermus lipocalidus]ADI02372.1 hypothetical protein Slip_1611 [Syntrophothermus lipocalidus DSM 12680]
MFRLFKKRETLAKFNFTYGPIFCHIEGLCKEPSDDLLILSYLMFVSRYFFICDERQIAPMQAFLNDFSSGELWFEEYSYFHEAVQVTVFKTFTEEEKSAVIKLFSGMSPLLLTQDINKIKKPSFKYSLEVFRTDNDVISGFRLSVGPDKILLPLTVSLFFEYVVKHFRDERSVERIMNALKELMDYYEHHDCRSKGSLFIAPSILDSELGR